ncbi:Zinc finger C2H2-type [Trinorchestia longiramus]|nr:Zinc finger C2H2-type [Trinorchestia longiramus]
MWYISVFNARSNCYFSLPYCASPSSAPRPSQVHEYLASDLQQQLQQQQTLEDEVDDDDGDVSSDDADMPALVVNEDNPDQAQTFECTHCQAKLANSNLLRRHVEDLHKQMRKHVCALCSKAFKRKEHLERHVRIHTGCKPFECSICLTKFTQKEHLKGHIDNVHFKKKTSQRRNVKIAPAVLKAGGLAISESSKGTSEQTAVMTNGPVSGGLVNGSSSSNISVLALSSDAFALGGKKSLLPRVNDSPSSPELGRHGGLLGRMVGSSGVVANSIGGAMSSNLSTALNLLAATATAVAPHVSSSSAGDGSDDIQLSSRNSSPPSLTSPTTLALSSSNIPFTGAPFAGSIFSTTNFPKLMLSNTTNSISSSFLPTITSVSPLNSVFTANLPNTTFSTSPNAAFQNQDGDTVVKELRMNSSIPTPPSSRGSGRGRGRGALARRGKTSKLPRVSLGRGGSDLSDSTTVSPPSSSSGASVEGGSTSITSEGSPGVTPLSTTVKRKSPSSAEKHIKKVVLNYH